MSPLFIRFAIDLGDFSLQSVTSLSDILWYIGGLIILLGLTALVIYHHRRTRPDPFESAPQGEGSAQSPLGF